MRAHEFITENFADGKVESYIEIVDVDLIHAEALAEFIQANPHLVETTENFADGKKPGRKGLAKRSGVNCKASVTSLRKIAKNSSGEKQRMAHWCGNMKSGKKK
jgi:hypothetical protein